MNQIMSSTIIFNTLAQKRKDVAAINPRLSYASIESLEFVFDGALKVFMVNNCGVPETIFIADNAVSIMKS